MRASSPYYAHFAQEKVAGEVFEQPAMTPADSACMSVQSCVEWEVAFRQQATDALLDQCRRYAQTCLHAYRLYDAPEDDRDLVLKALGDIFGRSIQWDPAQKSLLDQVCDVVRYRVRDLKRSAARRRAHAPIVDDADEDVAYADDVRGAMVGERARATVGSEVLHVEGTRLGGAPEHPEAQLRNKQARELGARIATELAQLVAQHGDEEAAAILACWWSGTSERKDILAETGMSADVYHHARRRLVRLAGQLSNELRAKGKAQAK